MPASSRTETPNVVNQLTNLTNPNQTLTYDADGNLTNGFTKDGYSFTATYDALNRKISETLHYGTFSKTFRYSYYANGQKQSFTLPNGLTSSYAYDAANQLKNIRIPGVGNIEYPSYTVGRPDSVQFPSGNSQSYTYDAVLRLQQTTATSMNTAYTYDPLSNILTKQTEHGNYAYGYDDVSRLLSSDNPTLDDEAWMYDWVGNRQTASGVTGTITHNENNELTLYGETAYGYDDNGNLIRKQLGTVAVNYTYDAANRLVKVEDELTSTVIAEYSYDPFGRRLWKEVSGTRTYFLYADEGLVAEYDANGNELRSYGYESDSTWGTNPLWLKQSNSYYWYQNDHLGTPQKLVAQNGTVVWSATYEAFGKAHVEAETVVNNLRFPGQYFDAETGLHYNWNRYYEPGSGRYTQTDPIGFNGGDVNWYGYAGNNPINLLDPSGLKVFNNSGPWIIDDKGNLVKNNLPPCRVYVKPGGRDDAPPGREDITLPGENAYEVAPGTCFVEPYQDGVGSPNHPDPEKRKKVLKTSGRLGIGVDVTVNPDCSFDYNWWLSSWKDLEWKEKGKHNDWSAIFDAVTMGKTTQEDTIFSQILEAMKNAQKE